MIHETPEPDSPQHWIKESIALRQNGKLQAAAEACQHALALAPGNADALSNLAHALRWQGRFAEAFDAAGKAIEAAPRMAAAWFNYAAALEGLGRAEEAMTAYRRAVELKPDYAEAWSNLGNVLAEQKRDDDALEAYRRAVHHNPNLAPIWSNLGDALRHGGQIGEAIEASRRAITLDPGFSPGWSNLGLALHDQGLLAEATKALSRAVELDPAFATWQNLGDVLESEQRFDEAEQAYRHALAAGAPTAALLTKLGGVLKRQGRVNNAIDTIKQALAIDPNHVPALAEAGQLFRGLNRPEDAETHHRTAVEAMLGAIGAGDVESALAHEYQIYHAFVQPVETEEHYRRCFSDWQAEMAALGERFKQTLPHTAADPREIAFFLHAGHVLGHTEVLLKILEELGAGGDAGPRPRLYIFGTFDDQFLARVERLRVPVVLLERALPRGAATPFHQRFFWLRERFRQDRIGVCVWVSSPLWATFAFSMRLAPVQIFWALRFHPIAGPYIDGYITYGAKRERERLIGKQPWKVIPVPLAIEATPPDSNAVAGLRARFPQGFLAGTLAREEKINQPAFLAAVTRILQANPHVGYIWTGRTEHPGILGHFRAAGVADRCHFVGWVDTKLYAAALDLFLESFPFGTGVIPYQALGLGTPLLSYLAPTTVFGVQFWHDISEKTGGAVERRADSVTDEILSHYPLCCARTPEEYVQLANRLISDAAFRSEVAGRGKKFFEEEINNAPYCAERFFATIREIAAETLEGRGGISSAGS